MTLDEIEKDEEVHGYLAIDLRTKLAYEEALEDKFYEGHNFRVWALLSAADKMFLMALCKKFHFGIK